MPHALQGLRVFCHLVRKEFQCDVTTEFKVFGFVDHTHPAATEFSQHAVVRDGMANDRGGIRHWPSILRQSPSADNRDPT